MFMSCRGLCLAKLQLFSAPILEKCLCYKEKKAIKNKIDLFFNTIFTNPVSVNSEIWCLRFSHKQKNDIFFLHLPTTMECNSIFNFQHLLSNRAVVFLELLKKMAESMTSENNKCRALKCLFNDGSRKKFTLQCRKYQRSIHYQCSQLRPTKYSFACSSRLEVTNVKTLLKFPHLGSSQEKKKPKVESSETKLKDFHGNLTKDG